MAEEGLFHRRSLASWSQGAFAGLDALRWPTPFGSGLRFYFAHRSETQLAEDKAGAVRITEKTLVSGNLIADATGPAGAGPVRLGLGGREVEIPTSAPETWLFDDLDVLLALRHGEGAAQVAEWLGFHAAHHGLTGALVVDRAPPGKARDAFAADLATAAAGIAGLARLVLVDAPVPLGHADQPAVGDPATAPRARDRSFTPDPWRAALAEPAVYDILKRRFLARAGAVIALDPCDLLDLPGDGPGAFDAVRQSHTGMMPVTGRTIFPWRVRKGQDPRFGDHICRPDPPESAPTRWAVAPKRAETGALWLPNGVAGMAGIADETLGYDRAMSVLYPGTEIAWLVNKDVLDAVPKLERRARDLFGGNPVRPPRRKPAEVTATLPPPPSGRTLIVTCMKNEGPFLLEWIAYHRMIGVDDFLVYTNDCDDGTDALLDALAARGLVQRRDNPFRETGAKPQQAALDAALAEDVLQRAGWIISMDVDEFINVHVGGHRLPDLYAAAGEANVISLTWRLFGNSDVEAFEDRPVIEQFTRCAPHLIRRPHQAWGIKTLFRNQGLFESLGVHRPKGYRGGPVRWINGSGRPMPARMLRTGWRSGIDTYGYDLATLNHYAVRSAESFLVKRDRGRVNHVARDQGEAYWFRMNNNDEQDLSIQRHVQGLEAEIAALKQDAGIAALHDRAVAWHRERIARLRAAPDFAALYGRLTSERMRLLSRMHRHFGMNVFLSGPSVIPDKVFDADLPRNFFFNTAPPAGKAAD